ncbi:hypothetical protein PU683_07620 [Kosakonia cowanii]|uniref:hypothetical protein n=1 Tax=Kosakonia cowanii TaxID=208223 RepID=UPI0023F786E2|nr:hypothetical protein [Kosakonia cowanii]MDF7759397.1 hypothetical protein [Kosakonia cowanii]
MDYSFNIYQSLPALNLKRQICFYRLNNNSTAAVNEDDAKAETLLWLSPLSAPGTSLRNLRRWRDHRLLTLR